MLPRGVTMVLGLVARERDATRILEDRYRHMAGKYERRVRAQMDKGMTHQAATNSLRENVAAEIDCPTPNGGLPMDKNEDEPKEAKVLRAVTAMLRDRSAILGDHVMRSFRGGSVAALPHDDEGIVERAYWNAGYTVALNDVLRMIERMPVAWPEQIDGIGRASPGVSADHADEEV